MIIRPTNQDKISGSVQKKTDKCLEWWWFQRLYSSWIFSLFPGTRFQVQSPYINIYRFASSLNVRPGSYQGHALRLEQHKISQRHLQTLVGFILGRTLPKRLLQPRTTEANYFLLYQRRQTDKITTKVHFVFNQCEHHE